MIITLATIINLSLTPSKAQLLLKPGNSAYQKVVVKNYGSPVNLSPDIFPFYTTDLTGNPQIKTSLTTYDPLSDLKNVSMAYPVMNWKKTIRLETNEEKDFIFKFSSDPINTTDKYYLLAFKAEGDPITTQQIKQTATFGVPVMISAGNTENDFAAKLTITDFKVPFLNDSLLPLKAKATVENTGLHFFDLNGYWEVIPIIGSPKRYPIISDTIITKGTRNVRCQTISNDCKLYPSLPLGFYKVRLVIEGINLYKKEKAVLVFPFSPLAGILSLIFVWKRIIKNKTVHSN
jgi:hypothetical protein